MLELRSEKTVESTLHRLGKKIPLLFEGSAIEIFVPVVNRDLGKFELNTSTMVYARSPHFQRLLRLRSVTGVVGLATKGDSGIPSQALKVENEFVQEQIAAAESKFRNWAASIEIGSFVRIMDGDMRDWCGTVTNIIDGVAIVRVELKTKVILVETPVRNLIDKSYVPFCLRVFYYSDLVDELLTNNMEHLLKDDLHFEGTAPVADDGLNVQQAQKHSRQQTVTALVKRMVVQGNHDPKSLGSEVLKALKEERLKKPKTLSIVHGIIKSRLIDDHFKHKDPTIRNYRDVIERFGERYRFSLNDLAAIDPGLGIPLNSGESSAQGED